MQPTANTPSLLTVANQYRELRVADYQRSYEWTKTEIQDFFDDVVNCSATKDYHFFGTLILCQVGDGKAEIVDGQQRLTTVFIFAAAVRDQIARLGIDTLQPSSKSAWPVNVRQRVWEFIYSSQNFSDLRLHSNQYVHRILRDCVFAEPDKQKPLPTTDLAVTRAFRRAVRDMREILAMHLDVLRQELGDSATPERELEELHSLIETVLDRFLVLQVTTAELDESLEIFLTLNDRGRPLGPSDIVRGRIMNLLSSNESEADQRRIFQRTFDEWRDIAELVREPETFLRHYLVATTQEKVQKKKIVRAVEDQLAGAQDTRKMRARQFWTKLREASRAYGQVINPTMGGLTQYYLELLEGLSKSHRILLMTVLLKEPSKADTQSISRATFALVYRWNIAGLNAQKLEDTFQKMANAYLESADASTLLDTLLAKAEEISLDGEAMLIPDADEGFTTRALLHAVNRFVAPGAEQIPLSALHLEHIAPQSNTETDWELALFGSNADRFVEYDEYMHSLGNLTLLDAVLNMQAKKDPFALKKTYYNDSAVRITRDLKRVHEWTAELIELRGRWLSDQAQLVIAPRDRTGDVIDFMDWLKRHGHNALVN